MELPGTASGLVAAATAVGSSPGNPGPAIEIFVMELDSASTNAMKHKAMIDVVRNAMVLMFTGNRLIV
jgi:hypothetical protein